VGTVAVVGLLTGGLLWWASDGKRDGDAGNEPYCGIGGAGRTRAARIAYFEAGQRLLQAGTFAYQGEVHAAEQTSFRPRGWTTGDATVEGAVALERGLTHDMAVDAAGRASETVTSGPRSWTRSASTLETLSAEPWAFRISAGPTVGLGPTGVLPVVLSARDPQEQPPDAAGRCVIQATVPSEPYDLNGELLVGANVSLTLDEDRNIARIVLTSAPDDPELVVELDVTQVGEPQAIAPPRSRR
jgi:hypothetical protein